MEDDAPLTITFGDGEPLVEFPVESVTVSVPLAEVGDGLYRLDGVPFGVESAAFGDVIEAESVGDGRLLFVCVAERGGWRTFDFVVSEETIGGERLRSLLAEVEARGGHWETLFGGLLFICVPPGLDFDPTPRVAGA